MRGVLFCLLAWRCSEPNPSAAFEDLSPPPGDAAGAADLASAKLDEDGDGLDDAQELAWARDYAPFLSLSPQDGCPTSGLLVRVTPHAQDPKLLHILYVWLFDKDCGLGGHDGDDEVFGTTVDPSKPAPAGLLAMKAISHQGTPCERVSSCGQCGGLAACQSLMRGGAAWPAIWPSRGKHGLYVNRSQRCTLVTTCADACEDNGTSASPPMVNAGEPARALVHDLTTGGFITAQNGWQSAALMHFDPWADQKFGGAGNVSQDLVDPAFDTPVCP